MERKPFVTYHGEQELFTGIQVELIQKLPREKVEWRRSFGRVKMIEVDVNFVPFSADLLPVEDVMEHSHMLLQLPMLHVYFTDCPDTDAYRIVMKDKIAGWLNLLKDRNIQDWMIVLVEPANPRRSKSKLLPTFSVVDKIKNDFCGRQAERLVVLHEPNNPVPNNKTIESWSTFVNRLRQLFVTAYNRTFSRYEDVVRAERERRPEKDWNFCNYFLLQEELALAFEAMNIYEEALVQYDELDALFTQFVINSQAGEKVSWLSTFTDSCSCWDGLNLSDPLNKEHREVIRDGKPSLLYLRNYLFSRQCSLLFKMRRPSEVAYRSQNFMHTCVQELSTLEVLMPPGSVACWVFLTCVEVLQKYEKMSDVYQMETHSHYTANLWVYAQRKLSDLGNLFGLMPDTTPTSEQLNAVVNLMSGMGNSSPSTQNENSPNQKLREALSSSIAFQRHYLELSELAMGNFKHIGRQRSVAVIGKELARFYQLKEDYQKAELFLEDALRRYEKEGWKLLMHDTRQQLADCQKKLSNKEKYINTCCFLMGDPLLEKEKKLHYFQEIIEAAQTISSDLKEDTGEKEEVIVPFQSCFGLSDITILDNPVTCARNTVVTVAVDIFSRFSELTTFQLASICFQDEDPIEPGSPTSRGSLKSVSKSLGRKKSQESAEFYVIQDLSTHNMVDLVPDIRGEVRTADDGRRALITCRNTSTYLKRQDSTTSWGKSKHSIIREECSLSADLSNIELKPGPNLLQFKFQSNENGLFKASQLVLELVNGISFLLSLEELGSMSIEVFSPEPQLTINLPNELYAGVPEKISFTITTGYQVLKKGDYLPLICSEGLIIFPEEKEGYAVESTDDGYCLRFLEDVESDREIVFPLMVMSTIGIHLEDGEDDKGINHIGQELELEVPCPWLETVTRALHFNYPFTISHKCHTVNTKKLIQLSATNETAECFDLSCVQLEIEDIDDDLESISQPSVQTLGPKLTHSYVWFLPEVTTCKSCLFSISYVTSQTLPKMVTPPDSQVQYSFGIADLKTKYIVSSSVSPGNGKDICSMGALCNFYITIQVVDWMESKQPLYYEVQTLGMWVMCGKNRGVVDVNSTTKVISVKLEMLPLVSGYLPLPDIKFSEYMKGEDKDEPDASTSYLKNDSKQLANPNSTPQQFGSNHVYYKSSATQIHVFPECNTNTVEVSIS